MYYKNNGAVSLVEIDFHLIRSLYHARTQHDISKPHASLTFQGPWVYSNTELDTNCNTFFMRNHIPICHELMCQTIPMILHPHGFVYICPITNILHDQ